MYDPGSPRLRTAVSQGGAPPPEAKARFAEDRLLDAVIWCEAAPGEIISEADAMERFGLTRAAARAGLTRLGYDGWAAPQPRTGWLILPVTGALIGDVLEARRVAEPSLAYSRIEGDARTELEQIAGIVRALDNRAEAGARAAARHYAERVDGLMLQAINPFTARHLRKLWHHSVRIARFFEEEERGPFPRDDLPMLIDALLARDGPGIAAVRDALIDAQEAYFLRRLLRSDAPLMPGGAVAAAARTKQTDTNRREI